MNCAKAVVEHHFDNHEFCGNFCKRKLLSDEEREASRKIYRDKEDNAKLYAYLTTTLARFITPSALKEVAHGSDTQVNESLNNSITWFAQKNKTYAATSSLSNRVCFALGIYSVGYKEFFIRLLERCGIEVTDDILYYLEKQQKTRVYRKEKDKRHEIKKKRNAKLHGRLKDLSLKLEAGAEYSPGIGMNNGYADDEEQEKKPAAKLKCGSVCTTCGEDTHKRSTNRLCPAYKPPKKRDASCSLAEVAAQVERDAHEQSLLDEIGFELDGDEFFNSFELEEDVVDDEDEGAPVVNSAII